MKPKSKLDKRMMEINSNLKPIPQTDIDKAFKTLFKGFFIPYYKTKLICSECGHVWHKGNNYANKETCPNCKQVLAYTNTFQKSDSAHAIKCEKHHEFQVVRKFVLIKNYKKKCPATTQFKEVINFFIDEKGNTSQISRPLVAIYYDRRWDLFSPLEPRNNSQYCRFRNNIETDYKLPGNSYLPVLKRNGFKHNFYDILPERFIKELLVDPKVETLLKAKQYNLLNHAVYTDKIRKYWSCIKQVVKHNYTITNEDMYFDMLQMMQRLGKDTNNPTLIMPKDISADHNKYLNQLNRAAQREKDEERKANLKQEDEHYINRMSNFFKLKIETPNVNIEPLKSATEVYHEGKALHHCVYQAKYHTRKNVLLLSARINDNPIETIEVSLADFSIQQARGLQNAPSVYHSEIIEAVNKNMTTIKQLAS